MLESFSGEYLEAVLARNSQICTCMLTLLRASILLFIQNAAKRLLGIGEDTAISIRFADPPFATVSDVSTILKEPSHIVNLIVSPLTSLTEKASENGTAWKLKSADERDPYCRYRERYGGEQSSRSGQVRTKCNLAQMNRLLSQLSDVSLRLQRTQDECDEIARRCRRKNAANGSVDKAASSKIGEEHRDEGVDFTVDSNVEKLLHIAESLTQKIIAHQKLGSSGIVCMLFKVCMHKICLQ